MVAKLLTALIKKEKLIAHALSFSLGASAAALGVNAEAVKQQFCADYLLETDLK